MLYMSPFLAQVPHKVPSFFLCALRPCAVHFQYNYNYSSELNIDEVKKKKLL